MSKTHMVGLGGIHASKTPGDVIKTMALGSCIGIIAVAPRLRAVGMAHIVLPHSRTNLEKAATTPGYFADTGIPALLEHFQRLGLLNPRELVFKLAGGASVMDPNSTFDIGKRNILSCRKELWKHRLAAIAEDIGGNFSRTVWVEVDTGRMYLQSPGKGRWEL